MPASEESEEIRPLCRTTCSAIHHVLHHRVQYRNLLKQTQNSRGIILYDKAPYDAVAAWKRNDSYDTCQCSVAGL